MGSELVYTSARKGLKPGSVGFCTVAMSQGMSPQMAAMLESLSGYRHLNTTADSGYAENPVNFCHYLIPDRGRLARVVGRVGAASPDYSGRTNKLAHFIVLDAAEQAPAGPAWLLQCPGFMMQAWTGEPHWIQTPRAIPSGDSRPAHCATWHRVTGDAGWAGELLGRFCERPENPVHIICHPDAPMLDLFAEALALLPVEIRWQIAFSTYFTGLALPGIKCHWRGVVAGSAMGVALDPKTVFDLTRTLGRASDSPYCMAARNGTLLDPAVIRGTNVIGVEPGIRLAEVDDQPLQRTGVGKQLVQGSYELDPVAAAGQSGRLPPLPYTGESGICETEPRRSRWIIPVILGAAALVILVLIAAIFVSHYLSSKVQWGWPEIALHLPKLEKASPPAGQHAKKPTPPGQLAKGGKPSPKLPTKKPMPVATRNASTPTAHPTKKPAVKVALKKKPPPAVPKPVEKPYRTLIVINKSIFAVPKGGGLMIGPASGPSEPKPASPIIQGVKAAWIALPPIPANSPGSLVLRPKWMAGAKNKILIASLKHEKTIYQVRWERNANAGAGNLSMGPGQQLIARIIFFKKGCELKVTPGPAKLGHWVRYAERMAIGVKLANGQEERAQFLLGVSHPAHLNTPMRVALSGRVVTDIGSPLITSTGICLVEESIRPRALTRFVVPGKRGKSFSIYLASDSIAKERRNVLTFNLAGIGIFSNYSKVNTFLNKRLSNLNVKVKKRTGKVGTDEATIRKCKENLKSERVPRKNWSKNRILTSYNNSLSEDRKKLGMFKKRKQYVTDQLTRLKSLKSIKFRVELYPGGPVLERIMYERKGGK